MRKRPYALRSHSFPRSLCALEELYLGVTTAGPGQKELPWTECLHVGRGSAGYDQRLLLEAGNAP